MSCIDTIYYFKKNRIDTSINIKEYICVKDKHNINYFYLKETPNGNPTTEYIIVDSATYYSNPKNSDKPEFMQLMPYFADFYYYFMGSDSFFYRTGDTMELLGDRQFIHKVNLKGFNGHECHFVCHYFFNTKGSISKMSTFNNCSLFENRNTTYNFHSSSNKTNLAYIKLIKKRVNAINKKIALLEEKKPTIKEEELPLLNINRDSVSVFFKENYLNKKNKKLSLDSLIEKNKITILYFFFASCPPCKVLKPHLDTMLANYGSKGLNILGFDNIDPKKYSDSLHLKYSAFFHSESLDEKFRIQSYPTVIVMNGHHRILARMTGCNQQSLEDLTKYIDSLFK